MTAVQEAFLALFNHCFYCPGCQPIWVGDQPTHRECPVANVLYEQWRRTLKVESAARP